MGAFATGGGVVSLLTASIFSTGWFGKATSKPEFGSHHEIAKSGLILTPSVFDESGDEIVDCNFWNFSHYYSPSACSPFAVSRIAASARDAAKNRAIHCAAKFDSQCILAGEVGFSAPAAFIYDAEVGMKMILSPRILADDNGNNGVKADTNDAIVVRLEDPSQVAPNFLVRMKREINIEYLDPDTRSVIVETLSGSDAYCVQTLRISTTPACWTELD